MKISKKTDYALRALFTLVEFYNQKPIPIRELARRNDMPKKFLEHIMLDLKTKGWVESFPGKNGGYVLCKNPDKISMGEVVRYFDGVLSPISCVSTHCYERCSQESVCRFRRVFLNVRNGVFKLMDEASLKNVFDGKPVTTNEVFSDMLTEGARNMINTELAPENPEFDPVVNRAGTGSLKWDKYKDRDIIPLWVADMDFRSPQCIVQALTRRASHGIFGYTMPPEETVGAVVNYMQKRHDYRIDSRWISWLPGLVPALNVACRAVGQPGDAIMACTPVYPPFLTAPGYSDRKLIEVPLKAVNGLMTFDFESMEKAVTPDTKLFMLCNPHNPVGRVFERRELEVLGDFCLKHKLIICSDEIHCDIILDNSKHIPMATLNPEAANRTITLMSPSKTYNLAGLSCAFAVICNPEIRAAFNNASRGIITEVNAFGYTACAAAYTDGEPWRQRLISYLRDNRDFAVNFIRTRMPGIKIQNIQATYMAWLDVRELKLKDPAAFFENAGVGLSDGRHFRQDGFLRMNFGCPRNLLEEGLRRMEQAIAQNYQSLAEASVHAAQQVKS